MDPVSSEISDLSLLASYFASQRKETKLGFCYFDVYCVIKTFWLDVRYPLQATEREKP